METKDTKERKRFILHFDVNGTICPFDSSKNENISMNEKLKFYRNTTIVKYLKGIEKDGKFVCDKDGTLTYKEFLAKKFTKKERDEISQNIIKDFGNDEQVKEMNEKLEFNESILIESFTKCVERLDYQSSFILLFRTFGSDLSILEKELIKHFPNIPIKKNIPNDIDSLRKLIEIELKQDTNCFYFVQDDWNKWNKNGEKAQFGKDYPISDKYQSYFFDDNEDIVNTRNEKGEFIENHKSVIYVDTYKNVIDEFYFENIIFPK